MNISKTEYEIMQLIWQNEGWVSGQEVCRLTQGRGWKAPTVLSFLGRLCEKGLLETKKEGKLRFYRPLLSQQEYARGEAQELVDTLYGGQPGLLIASLAQNGLTEADRAQLKELLKGSWE